MIRMEQYSFIRTAHRVYGKSIRQISRETGHSRKTIRKILCQEPYVYSCRQRQPYPVLAPYLPIIDNWLEEDKSRPKKQRHTARRIYHRLVREHGFTGCESNVRHYVRGAKVRLGLNVAKAFIPLEPECGREAEVDWGAATAIISGEKMPIKFFCPSFPGSTSCAAILVSGSRPSWTAISTPLPFSAASTLSWSMTT